MGDLYELAFWLYSAQPLSGFCLLHIRSPVVYIFGRLTFGLLLLPSVFWIQMPFPTFSLLHFTPSQNRESNKSLIIISLTIHIYFVTPI